MALANYSVWGDRLHEKQHVRDWYQCVTATNIRVKLSIVRTFMLTLASLSCGSLDLGTMARDESLLFLLILPLKCFSHVRVKHTERAYVWFTVLLYCLMFHVMLALWNSHSLAPNWVSQILEMILETFETLRIRLAVSSLFTVALN